LYYEDRGDKKDKFHLEDWALPRKLGAKSFLRRIFPGGMGAVQLSSLLSLLELQVVLVLSCHREFFSRLLTLPILPCHKTPSSNSFSQPKTPVLYSLCLRLGRWRHSKLDESWNDFQMKGNSLGIIEIGQLPCRNGRSGVLEIMPRVCCAAEK
jgi:hypothetical protein